MMAFAATMDTLQGRAPVRTPLNLLALALLNGNLLLRCP